LTPCREIYYKASFNPDPHYQPAFSPEYPCRQEGWTEDGRMAEQLLTTDQLAEYLNVDKFTVYRLISQKEIPAIKVGNQWRFKKKLIEAWLSQNSNIQRSKSRKDTM
jgi:excisionase family DNA binding protein